jgi:hypothetical protein
MRAALLLFASAALSCGGGANQPALSPDGANLPPCPALRYMPLVDGNQWAYDAEDDETGEKGMFVTRARRLPGAKFSLNSSQGSHVLDVREDGIVRSETSAYLLKAPLTANAEWPGEGGATVRITSSDRTVDVPAGKFVGCIETIEEVPGQPGKDPLRRVTTTYCPDVGVALLHAEVWKAGKHEGEHATLRSFGKPIQFEGGSRERGRDEGGSRR